MGRRLGINYNDFVANVYAPELTRDIPVPFGNNDHDAYVNVRRVLEMPLHLTARMGYTALAEVLISDHADVNAQGLGRQTPLHYAAQAGNGGVVQALIAAHADVNAQDGNHRMPLHYAAEH